LVFNKDGRERIEDAEGKVWISRQRREENRDIFVMRSLVIVYYLSDNETKENGVGAGVRNAGKQAPT
jgi:hypothetical protein